MNSLKTPKPLLVARMAFPLAASLITVLLGHAQRRQRRQPEDPICWHGCSCF